MWDEPLVIATRSFRSRLVVGAERYPSAEIMQRSHDAAGAELVAVAVRGLDLSSPGERPPDVDRAGPVHRDRHHHRVPDGRRGRADGLPRAGVRAR